MNIWIFTFLCYFRRQPFPFAPFIACVFAKAGVDCQVSTPASKNIPRHFGKGGKTPAGRPKRKKEGKKWNVQSQLNWTFFVPICDRMQYNAERCSHSPKDTLMVLLLFCIGRHGIKYCRICIVVCVTTHLRNVVLRLKVWKHSACNFKAVWMFTFLCKKKE